MGTKKGKGTPYQTEALLPVIFCTTVVLAIYPVKARLTLINRGVFKIARPAPLSEKGKTTPISNRASITLFLPSTPSSVLSVARNPLALPLVD
jgi:hypothetical protein